MNLYLWRLNQYCAGLRDPLVDIPQEAIAELIHTTGRHKKIAVLSRNIVRVMRSVRRHIDLEHPETKFVYSASLAQKDGISALYYRHFVTLKLTPSNVTVMECLGFVVDVGDCGRVHATEGRRHPDCGSFIPTQLRLRRSDAPVE